MNKCDIKVSRIDEEGQISFEAACPVEGCENTELSVVHYGEEEEARKSAIGKICVHLRTYHQIEITT